MPVKPLLLELQQSSRRQPLCIAHRGASAHRLENTLEAFQLAARMNADFWELDVWRSADGICVVSHDNHLRHATGQDIGIDALSYEQLQQYPLANGEQLPSLAAVIELAIRTDSGLYIELKDPGSGPEVVRLLQTARFEKAIIAGFDADAIAMLADQACPYPLAVMVAVSEDPLIKAATAQADIVHLCWEKADRHPHQRVTETLLRQAQEQQLAVVLWHEERPAELAHLLTLPVLAICTNNPELMNTYQPDPANAIAICCHRGAHRIAPENTLPAAELGLCMGAQVIELDLHTSLDGQLMVIHDSTLDRTTNLMGPVSDYTARQLAECDAGSWFHQDYQSAGIPLFSDYLHLIQRYQRQLFVELKQVDVDQVISEVSNHSLLESCFFWSFNSDYLDQIQHRYPQARVMRRRQDFPDLETLLASGTPAVVEYDYRIDDLTEMDRCRARGAQVMIRFFADRIEDALPVIELRPDLVNLDDPFLFQRAYQQWLNRQ
ncbi:glycerophosphodiester phosphodiesterase [Gynuella sunshinyii]|uniref:Glycerophosphoryl diester phosphodiesterase n=1 Tax=Gynuella sunshinyii YC6258 TaxID=1445510 RepID=A0A0C5VDT0_9GAMM|nr:glycerophosphodiester phosphodiesterase family protein [Gynuella sunshinyii]AJQ92677.1 glycerophosphoryl diester phosphodiesterase [Gynuella sunshinyii YC6258]